MTSALTDTEIAAICAPPGVLHVVSVSGGKDSAATAILALETMPRESLRFAFCDTGNEHESTIEYVAYMARHLGIDIVTLPQPSFADRIARQRDYVRSHWAGKGATSDDIERAVAALVPTGNPFLDLCILKGRFPSRKAQFCTQELKTIPLVEHQMGFIERGSETTVDVRSGTLRKAIERLITERMSAGETK